MCSLHREGFRVGVSCVLPAGGGAQGGCVVCAPCRGRGSGWVCRVCFLQGEGLRVGVSCVLPVGGGAGPRVPVHKRWQTDGDLL